MKNNILLLLAALVVLSFASCKKKIENCKLGKSYMSDGTSTPNPNTFYYYSDGSVQKITYSDRSKDTLVYNLDTLTVFTFDYRDSLTSVFTGILNSNRDVTTGTKVYYNYFGTVISTETYLMDYNTAGNIIQQTVTNATGTNTLALNYADGNSTTGTLMNGVTLEKEYIFYHNNAENKTGVDDMNGIFTPYFGNPSLNLLDSTHIITSTDTIRIQYAHTLDANDYVSKTIRTYLTPGVETKYFTYQYFDCRE